MSRRSFTPTEQVQQQLAATPFARPSFFPVTWMYDDGANKRTSISAPPAIAADDTGGAEANPVAIGQTACVLRNAGTFGLPGDAAGANALETRFANGAVVRAQDRAGYNVPSLYGVALDAPYLHHGQAPTLDDLFLDRRWRFHTNAGNANLSLQLQDASKLDDLKAFLLSIDETTEEIAIPTDPDTGASFDACP